MRITIEIHEGVPRRGPAHPRRSELELPEQATVGDAVARLGIDPRDPWNAAVDGRLAGPSQRLHGGARLIVFAAIEGG